MPREPQRSNEVQCEGLVRDENNVRISVNRKMLLFTFMNVFLKVKP